MSSICYERHFPPGFTLPYDTGEPTWLTQYIVRASFPLLKMLMVIVGEDEVDLRRGL